MDCKEEALAAYDKALKIQPDFGDAWFNKGYVLGSLGRTQEALCVFEKALVILRRNQFARVN